MKTNTTALLVMDLQMGLLPRMPQQGGQIIQNASQAIKVARQKAIPVIFIRLGFQKGLPEVSPDNKMFSTLKRNLSDAGLSEFMRIPTELGQQEQDLVIDKKRVSAFSGNSLDMILRAQGITHLVLSGISTGGIISSTFWAAFDKDYQISILSDGCADPDEQLHEFLMERLFAKYADVLTIKQWEAQD